MAVTNPRKAAIIEEFRESESDTGSARLQIAVLTDRIRHLTEHLKKFKKDHATRRGLLRLVGRRAALLRYFNLSDCVTFAGSLSEEERCDHYNLASLFAMPSKGEGFSIAHLEAMVLQVSQANQDGK